MTTRHLKIFMAVYIDRSMTAAAKKLYMTQPSVSQAIRELEEHYGTPLFERLSRKLYPTPAGTKLFLYAEKILGMFDEMESTLQSGNMPQTLELGLFFTAGMLVHPWLSAFRASFPAIQVHIHVWKGSELKRRLRNASIDLAIMERIQNEPDLRQEVVARDRLVAVTALDDPLQQKPFITAQELSEAPLLLREKGAGVRDQFQQEMQALGLSLTPQWESASSLVLLEAAKHQEGVAILPYQLARPSLSRGEVAELNVTGIDFQREMALTWHRDKFVGGPMQAFMDIARDNPISAEPLPEIG